jgi:cholinesterase
MRSALLFGSIGLTLLSTTNAIAIPEPLQARCKYPFRHLVAFGDEFSDNGNGSFAHGITEFTGDPKNVYGFGTWTNGPVAVSYLADMLEVPLQDFAFGGCCGGEKFGATLDAAFTKSDAGAPSLVQQISNYTDTSASDIKTSMQFIWAGQNDLSKHTDAFWLGDPRNGKFGK